MLLHKIDLPLQAVREGNVIGIGNGDIFSLGKKTSRVARFRQTAVGYLVERDSTILGGMARGNGFGFVRGAEVYEDEFKFPEGLTEDTLDGLREKALDIANHEDD
jgi:hypothetical protein